jgi:hypothetical protein
MKEDVLDAIKEGGVFFGEEKNQAVARCVDVINYLHEAASKIAINFILTQSDEKAEHFSSNPEALAVQAIQAAIRQTVCGGRKPGEPVH